MGFSGHLSTGFTRAEFAAAIRSIAAGEILSVTSPPDVSHTPGPEGAPTTLPWPGERAGLSPRESEVLCLIAQGMRNSEIAEQLFIGGESVKTHIRSAYRKIGVTDRSQAVIWALQHGLGPTP